ncbi:hypothetical protein GLU64_01655 [Nanohaloarchaea archaeon]|nr:hypothetical protein [Candidatus Nanohaloarchaea archaeon]
MSFLLLVVVLSVVGIVFKYYEVYSNPFPEVQTGKDYYDRNTDVKILKGKSSDTAEPQKGHLILEVQNTGAVTRNTSAFRVLTDNSSMIPGEGGLVNGSLSSNPRNSTLLDPDDTMDFYTGIPFPKPENKVIVTLDLKRSPKTFNITCEPENSSTKSC